MVARTHIEPSAISPESLISRLRELTERTSGGVLAFDADGTLWSGDVGENVFEFAVSAGLLREEPRQALEREARAFGIEHTGSTSALAARLFDAYVAGRYPEREACAMMTWCYAGFTTDELVTMARQAFAHTDLAARLHRELAPIFAFVSDAGVRAVVVSASPQPIIEQAVALWAIGPSDVAASRPALIGDRIAPELAWPVPYAEAKPRALRDLVGDATLLASFGDNVFDIELLRAARIGVAVRPKPALQLRLPELEGVFVLQA